MDKIIVFSVLAAMWIAGVTLVFNWVLGSWP
jgi:hypothetical protein